MKNVLEALAEGKSFMRHSVVIIADLNILALSAGHAFPFPVSSKIKAKTTTKTV